MSLPERRLEELLRNAPQSKDALFRLLVEGLDWPSLGELDPEDIAIDWEPEDFHLDPDKVAKLQSFQQIPPLVDGQNFGIFLVEFDGKALPIGAIKRWVGQLARKKRHSANTVARVWNLEDLLLFCQSAGQRGELHVVALRDVDGRRVLRTMSWNTDITPARLELLKQKGVPELRWGEAGPSLTEDLIASNAFTGYRQPIRTAKKLASHMAAVAQDVRREVAALYEVEREDGPIRTLFAEIRRTLISDLTPERFANVYAQTMVYGLLTARISHPEQFVGAHQVEILRFDNPFLDAIYSRFQEQADDLVDVDELGLADLAEELAQTDVDQLLADFGASDRRDDPVVHLYEDFLNEYDADERRNLGAYYTPVPVVRAMIDTVDHLMKTQLELPRGVADATTWAEYLVSHPKQRLPTNAAKTDPVISMIDPATGTGTFLLEWLRKVTEGRRGTLPALGQIAALEISPASYSVAHLKTSLELPPELRAVGPLPIYLADTLAGPQPQLLTGIADPVAEEATRAENLKFNQRQSVVIGNPPYQRVTRDAGGGWIAHPEGGGHSLFDDILDPARAQTIFSHQASLYNLYVYFWRWALWKSFQQNDSGPAIASFITASSWLTGPGFLGLRQLARQLADEIWVVDLGGDNHGARPEENIFSIEIPVAIVTLLRRASTQTSTPAQVHYSRIWGTREEKLQALEQFNVHTNDWQTVDTGWLGAMTPATGADDWADHPRLIDLLPWQQPGCKFGRTWPISPSRETLEQRWTRFLASTDSGDRARCFVTANSGRNIMTSVSGYPRLVDLPTHAPSEPTAPYGYRSFDEQHAFDDPRLAKTDSPSLWASRSPAQIFMVSKSTHALGAGPAATVSVGVPDLDSFRGAEGGKDVLPLYRDDSLTPNVDPDALAAIGQRHRQVAVGAQSVSAEDLFAYTYGILAGADYTARFAEELATPGPRVPLTGDPDLFASMAAHGRHLIWLHTRAQRFPDEDHSDAISPASSLMWDPSPSRIPIDTRDFRYDPSSERLVVADGSLTGVRPDAWVFEVSGMPVLKKWLGYRTAKGTGRAASSKSPLDQIRPTEWSADWSNELVELVHILQETNDLLPAGAALLDQILDGPLILAADLPDPPKSLREVPKAPPKRPHGQLDL